MDTTTMTTPAGTRAGSRRLLTARRARCSVRALAGPASWTIALALAIVVLGVAPTLLSGAPARPLTAISVRVGPSDTLWTIAAAHRMPGLSTAATVEEIRRANALTASNLSAGAILRVPSVQSAESAVAAADAEIAIR
jgi:LysM domain